MSDKDVAVSVIVPVYNVEEYLQRCIDSLVAQTLKNIEIILVDDGSTDGSPQICDIAAENNSSIKVIHKENGGLSSARNAGLKIACGTYISFVDSDDYVDVDMMEKLVCSAKEEKAELVVCNVSKHENKEIKENCLDIYNETLGLKGKRLDDFLAVFGTKISVFAWNKLYRHEIISKYKLWFTDTQKILSEDQLFLICYCRFVDRIAFVNESLYHYCIREASLSRGNKYISIINRWTNFAREVKRFMDEHDPNGADNTVYCSMLWGSFCSAAQHLKTKENFYEAMSMVEADNMKWLKKTFFCVAFGKAGSVESKKYNLDFKASLFLRLTAFLLLIGKYERPLETFLLPK